MAEQVSSTGGDLGESGGDYFVVVGGEGGELVADGKISTLYL